MCFCSPESVHELQLQIPKIGGFTVPTGHRTDASVHAECSQDKLWGRVRSLKAPPMILECPPRGVVSHPLPDTLADRSHRPRHQPQPQASRPPIALASEPPGSGIFLPPGRSAFLGPYMGFGPLSPATSFPRSVPRQFSGEGCARVLEARPTPGSATCYLRDAVTPGKTLRLRRRSISPEATQLLSGRGGL